MLQSQPLSHGELKAHQQETVPATPPSIHEANAGTVLGDKGMLRRARISAPLPPPRRPDRPTHAMAAPAGNNLPICLTPTDHESIVDIADLLMEEFDKHNSGTNGRPCKVTDPRTKDNQIPRPERTHFC